MRKLLLLACLSILPACADNHDEISQVMPETGTVQVPAQLLNVMHDGHLYVVALFTQGGAILHSPACPAERVR